MKIIPREYIIIEWRFWTTVYRPIYNVIKMVEHVVTQSISDSCLIFVFS